MSEGLSSNIKSKAILIVELTELELQRIFDNFYCIPQQDRWQYEGTGLGLALVKKQVEYLGGTIFVQQQNQKLSLIVELPGMCQV